MPYVDPEMKKQYAKLSARKRKAVERGDQKAIDEAIRDLDRLREKNANRKEGVMIIKPVIFVCPACLTKTVISENKLCPECEKKIAVG